ncbi:MAG: TonB-dependent receptor [Phenylobacterium sp.]|uniref:TonB-dependent receptor n=1 Tax=Phenylobacterium sp. TaxID=1871053 RepID=UPI001A509BBB|nr:TonB-dependent receptor [Phenylobacterium sp.]MBL8769924.1 TonB-dependent receptor [Phenylobacterium sp.]
MGSFAADTVRPDTRRSGALTWLACASVVALAGAGAPEAARAQTAGASEAVDVGEVLVTARKREERLRDVPVAASVLDVEGLEARGGVSDVQTLLSTVPGLRYFNTSTPANSEISLRGAGTSRGTSAEAAVGLYRNGAYIGGGGNLGGRNFSTADLFDIGRVEVLRGTQGALYGRNAVGGSINVISATPTQSFSGFADFKYGFENNRSQLQLVVNVPLSDSVAVRLGASGVTQGKGFFYAPFTDQYHDDEESSLLRGQIRYDKDGLVINLLAENQIARIPGLFYTYAIQPNAAAGYPLGLFGKKYESDWNTPPGAKQNIATINLAVAYDLGWASVDSTSMYRRRKSLSNFDSDATNPVALAAQRARGNQLLLTDTNQGNENHNLAEILFQDIHLTGAEVNGFTWLAGAELLQIKQNQANFTTRTPTAANRSTGNYTPTFARIRSFGVYGSVGYQVTEQLNLEAEGRYSKDKREVQTNRFDRLTGAVVTTGARLITSARSSPDSAIFNLTAGYKPTPLWLVYGKVGTGVRAGGFNTAAGDPRQPIPIPPAFGDEKSTTYELGAKGNITPNIYVTTSVYRTDIKDFLVQQDNGCLATNPVCPVSSTSFLINGGKAEINGVEADVAMRFDLFGGGLRINANAARQKGKVVAGRFKGARTPQTPVWNGSLNLDYRHDLVGGFRGFTNVTYSFQKGGIQEIEQFPKLHDSYTVDARIGVENGSIEAALYATNATDYDYIIFESETVRRWNQPRLFGAQVRYKW